MPERRDYQRTISEGLVAIPELLGILQFEESVKNSRMIDALNGVQPDVDSVAYFQTYHSGDFIVTAIGSIAVGEMVLGAVNLVRSRRGKPYLSSIKEKMVLGGSAAAMIAATLFAETYNPEHLPGFLVNLLGNPDWADIPAGLAGPAVYLGLKFGTRALVGRLNRDNPVVEQTAPELAQVALT